jgi:hypothetical protein
MIVGRLPRASKVRAVFSSIPSEFCSSQVGIIPDCQPDGPEMTGDLPDARPQ